MIGRFRVLHSVGRGAMGVVYAAHDSELDRRVAIKVLQTDRVDTDEYAEQLRSEARAMARVDHPNVIAVHDVGVWEGQPFIAMDFVDGPDLRDWLADDPPWADVVRLFAQAADGLAAAHGEGVVHRDFKPDNVLVATRRDGTVVARVADFGVASADRGRGRGIDPMAITEVPVGTGTPVASQSGAGTPAYMAPERYAGLPADARSDQFSFCVSLFEALAGERPFVAHSLVELALRVSSGRRADFPADSPVPKWIRRVVETGLAVDPRERYSSMAELAARLRDDPRRRRRVQLLVSAGVATSLALGGGALIGRHLQHEQCRSQAEHEAGTIWPAGAAAEAREAFAAIDEAVAHDAWSRVDEAMTDYRQRWIDTRRDLCVAEQIDDALAPELAEPRAACLDRRRLRASAFGSALERVDRASVLVAARQSSLLAGPAECADARGGLDPLPDDPAQRAAVVALRHELDRIDVELRFSYRVAESLDALGDLLERAEGSGDPDLIAEIGYALGLAHGRTDLAEAERVLSAALPHAVAGKRPDRIADLWIALYWYGGRLDESRIPDLERSAAAAVAAEGATDEQRARLEGIRGSFHALHGNDDAAIEAHERALALWVALPHRPHDAATTHNNLGYALHRQGRLPEAAEHYDAALRLFEDSNGPHHPALIPVLYNQTMIARERGRPSVGLEHIDRALELATVSVGERHPQTVSVLAERAAVLVDLRRFDEGLRDARRGLALVQQGVVVEAWLGDELERTSAKARAGAETL